MATRTSIVRMTGYSPVLDHAPGEAYVFDVDGKAVRMENWSTPNSSGTDYYDMDEPGGFAPSLVVDDAVADVMDTMAEQFETQLAEQYAERSIDAQITAARAAAIANVDSQSVEVEEDEEDEEELPEWTVFGLLDGDNLMVAAVIPGSHNVVDSNDNSDGFQRYATSVRAHDAADAETAAIDEAASA